jgi:hypothetical protein
MTFLPTLGRSLALALACFASLSCGPAPLDPGSLYTPVTDIAVYSAGLVEVGDTMRIEAEGFTNGQGYTTEPPRTVSFSLADSTILSLEKTTWTMPIMPAVLAHGLRPGVTTVTATINGVSGRDSLQVIPRIGSIAVTPVAATIHTNDTITFHVAVMAVDGSEITTVHPYTTSSVGGIAQSIGLNLYHGLKPGTIAITATLRRATGSATLTVLP